MFRKSIQTKSLSELTEVVRRGINSYYSSDDGPKLKLINISNIQNGKIDMSVGHEVQIEESPNIENAKVKVGDVVLGTKGSFKAAVVDQNIAGQLLSANVIALKVNGIKPKLLVAFLNSPLAQKQLKSQAAGTMVQTINVKDLMQIPIPIPSLDEQEKIVMHLDYLDEYKRLIARELELRNKIIWESMRTRNFRKNFSALE